MSRVGKVALVLLVLALVVLGLPVGMPTMSCPQCVLPVGAWCLLVVLTVAVAMAVPDRPAGELASCRCGCRHDGGRAGWSVLHNGDPSRSSRTTGWVERGAAAHGERLTAGTPAGSARSRRALGHAVAPGREGRPDPEAQRARVAGYCCQGAHR
jgi:hypothetical protein